MTTVAVVSSIYGDGYDRFVPEWTASLEALTRPPDEVILYRSDVRGDKHPQARIQNEAIATVTADWVWQLNVDDLALPDALNGIDDVTADVWLMGFQRPDGFSYVPKALPNAAYLLIDGNPYPSMSAFRRERFDSVGGYPLIAHEDWGLWRRLARAGARFESSGRVHSVYRSHPAQRTVVELPANRKRDLAALLADA